MANKQLRDLGYQVSSVLGSIVPDIKNNFLPQAKHNPATYQIPYDPSSKEVMRQAAERLKRTDFGIWVCSDVKPVEKGEGAPYFGAVFVHRSSS